jgi:GNAT superfamily N-acetyltransferase
MPTSVLAIAVLSGSAAALLAQSDTSGSSVPGRQRDCLPGISRDRHPVARGAAPAETLSMDLDVRPLASREASRAAALLTRAFAADPVITHYLWEPRRRRWAYPAFFRMALEEPLANGTAFAAEVGGELRAVAAWLPPEAGRPGSLERARARAYGAWVRILFPRTTAPLMSGFAALEEFHPNQPHWYLAFVGVEPEHQAAGIGTRLLEPVHERADATATGCYLETPFPATHAFYRGLGYELQRELRPFDGAPPVATFMREARPASL